MQKEYKVFYVNFKISELCYPPDFSFSFLSFIRAEQSLKGISFNKNWMRIPAE